jgi:AAHS family 4-hydroxybenzoate transporter-like MFS transporter
VTFLAFLVVLIEGFDITALPFAVPQIARDFGLSNGAPLAPALTASLVGMLFGAPLFGYLGDRIGRRPSIILACVLFGVFSLGIVFVNSAAAILWLRLLAGLGLGGATPNAIALVSEYAPHRHRALMIILMFTGISVGGAIPGIMSATMPSGYG